MKLRLPLQVGTTACWSLARCAAIFLPSVLALLAGGPVVLGVAMVGAWESLEAGEPKAATVILVVGAGAVLGILAFVVSAVKHIRLAMRERPSDVEFDEGRMRVVGGPFDGTVVDLARAKCTVETVHKDRMRIFNFSKGEPFATEDLELVSLKVDGKVIATSGRPIEAESLRALLDTIATQRQRADGTKPHGRPRKPKVTVVTCDGCGAIVAPRDEATVACAQCQAPVAIPSDLQQRQRAQRILLKTLPRNEARLAALLAQPRASTVGVIMLAMAVPILLVWPATGVAVYVLFHRGTLAAVNVAMLVPTALAAILSFFFLMRAAVVKRQALSIVSARFGALAPQNAGDPQQCRSCLAPIQASPDQLLVHCAYCDAENILGLDLRSEAGREVKQQRSLAAELSRRARERAVWTTLAVASCFALVGTRWTLPYAFAAHGDRARCRAGETAACLRDGRAREALDKADDGGDDDVVGAVDAFRIGCEHGAPEACKEAARAVYTWSRYKADASVLPLLEKGCGAGDGRACDVAANRYDAAGDPAKAVALYQRGSDLGNAGATSDLGYMIANGKGVAKDEGKGLALYRRACDAGLFMGCSNAAWMLEHQGSPDMAGAAALFDKACSGDRNRCVNGADFYARRCEAGDAPSCKQTVDIYAGLKGDTTKDEEHAYHVACLGGYADGCDKEGVVAQKEDPSRARGLFATACERGSAEGCNHLGVLYVKGLGVKKSLTTALGYYDKGCSLGSKFACDNRTQVRDMLAGH
jgi:hypothetical protein